MHGLWSLFLAFLKNSINEPGSTRTFAQNCLNSAKSVVLTTLALIVIVSLVSHALAWLHAALWP